MTITDLLEIHGPISSGDLSKHLARALDISVNAASRQIGRCLEIERMGGFLKSSQSICYLPKHREQVLAERLSDILKVSGKKYWFTLNSISKHNGILSRQYLECYTNYPILPLKGHIPFSAVMEKFVKSNILVVQDDIFMLSPKLRPQGVNTVYHHAVDMVKDQVLQDFRSLARNIGLISYDSGQLSGEFGKFRWAFKAVSAVRGLRAKGAFGFLVADILLGTAVYKEDVEFLVQKVTTVERFTNAPRLFPMLLIDDLDVNALKYLKSHGIVIGFIRELFGEKYAHTVRDLLQILNNAAASLIANPDRYLDLIKQLKKYNEGLAKNMKGSLFEYMIAHLHRENCQNIELGRQVIFKNRRYDIDVLAVYSSKIVVAECKATKQPIDESEIRKWINERLHIFKGWIESQEIYREKEVVFEYWSIGGFTEQAVEIISLSQKKIKSFQIAVFDQSTIRQIVINRKNKKMKEALDEYFFVEL
jgi:hypothetical protein